ncbi:MAG: SRPBCC domain-containing protein [Candidatus Eremiobacteraeota bacterium]|nr:SRPBCC domain-containing protein [Candidatus Eremiobacteraeota bacterium]
MADIMHLLTIDAPPERVYEALTTSDGIRSWWTRDADVDDHVGGIGEFRFYGGAAVTRVSIDELRPPARVVWTAQTARIAPWAGTTITFELRPEHGQTVVTFAQRGFAQADDLYAIWTTGWGYYLVSLKQYLEFGEGAPHPDVEFGRMVGAGNATR